VLVVVGVVGMVVAQSAFQSGALDLSLPTMTVTDPLSSIVIGATVFGERIASSPLALTVEVVSLAAMVVGVYVLARSEAKLEVAPAEAVQTEPGP
jgi:drug/metabolite transporter (DMT)-like permease